MSVARQRTLDSLVAKYETLLENNEVQSCRKCLEDPDACDPDQKDKKNKGKKPKKKAKTAKEKTAKKPSCKDNKSMQRVRQEISNKMEEEIRKRKLTEAADRMTEIAAVMLI